MTKDEFVQLCQAEGWVRARTLPLNNPILVIGNTRAYEVGHDIHIVWEGVPETSIAYKAPPWREPK